LPRASKFAATHENSAQRVLGNRPSRLRAEVAIKIEHNPQTSPSGSKADKI